MIIGLRRCNAAISLSAEVGMEDFNIREATASHKEGVICIHDNVYEGSDYLPVYYGHFVSSPDITPFILLHKDKIIGFSAAHIVDGGETLVTRAVRLNPEYEGKGLYGHLDQHILEWAKTKGISTKAFTSSDHNTNIGKSSFQAVNKLILTRNICIYFPDTTKLQLEITVDELTEDLTSVPDSLLKTYISEKAFKQYLFPENRIIADYVPLKLLESNIPLMRGPYDVTTVFSDVRCTNDQCTGLLSFNTIYPVKWPSFHCTLELFGTDENSLKKHVEQHLKLIKQKAEGLCSVGVYIEKQISSELLDKIFLEYGVERVIWRHPATNDVIYKDILLFEKTL